MPAACSNPYGTVDKVAKLIPEGRRLPGRLPEAERRAQAGLRRRRDRPPDRRPAKRSRGSSARTGSTPRASSSATGRHRVLPLQQKGADQEPSPSSRWRTSRSRAPEDGLPGPPEPRRDRQGGRARRRDRHDQIPLDDGKTYELLARGESTGVFQFESSGMREALRLVRPTEFEDLIALVALYRPGPRPTSRSTRSGSTAGAGLLPRDRLDRSRSRRSVLHLPGAVHGDRQAAGRLLARRGR